MTFSFFFFSSYDRSIRSWNDPTQWKGGVSAEFTGSWVDDILDVTAVVSVNGLRVGQFIIGPDILPGTFIVGFLTGFGAQGTYLLSQVQMTTGLNVPMTSIGAPTYLNDNVYIPVGSGERKLAVRIHFKLILLMLFSHYSF